MLSVGVLEGTTLTCGLILDVVSLFTFFQWQELLFLVLFFPFFHHPQYCTLGQAV